MMLLSVNMEEGWTILVIGMLVVYLSLLLLFAVFEYVLPRVLKLARKKPVVPQTVKMEVYTSGEQMAAVSAVVYLYLEETHDEENAIVTISKVSKSYSPWSSKIYVTHRLNTR